MSIVGALLKEELEPLSSGMSGDSKVKCGASFLWSSFFCSSLTSLFLSLLLM